MQPAHSPSSTQMLTGTSSHADYSMERGHQYLEHCPVGQHRLEKQNHLKTTFSNLKLYMLSPCQIVGIMRAKHDIATCDDVSKLRDSLSHALASLSDLIGHMGSFLLTSQRLTRSGQGETDYKYFELLLETVSGFFSVPASMAGYYTQYPAILQQSLATLFPFLTNLKDHLTRGDPPSPISGAAKALQRSATRNHQPRSCTNKASSNRLLHPRTVSVTPTPEGTKNAVSDLMARSPYKPPLPAPTRLQ
jgi:hypothetical protein